MVKNLRCIILACIIALSCVYGASPYAYALTTGGIDDIVVVEDGDITYNATATKKTALKITKQPSSVTAPKGKEAKVTVSATGDGLKYYWYYKNAGDSKYTRTTAFKSNTYTVTMSSARSGRRVYCKIVDKYGNSVKTNSVVLYMGNPLKITKQPSSVGVLNGETAKVSFTAKGDGLKYYWYYKNKGDSKFTRTTSFTSNYYKVTMSNDRSGRQVYCLVKDKYGNKVKTDVAVLSKGTPVKITEQPSSVTVHKGETAKVSFTAKGDGLKYKWYYKDEGKSSFSSTKTFSGNYYTAEMTSKREGRQVYCVVEDKYGNKAKTKTVTLSTSHKMGSWKVYREATVQKEGVERRTCKKCSYYNDRSIPKLSAVYYITVKLTANESFKVGVAANGKYKLSYPVREGYTFDGFKDSKGNLFAMEGKISDNVTISAVWGLDGTNTLQQLIDRTDAGVDKIIITSDIVVNQPIYISYNTKIYSDGNYTIKRDPSFTGDMFVVGTTRDKISATTLHRKAELTLGGGRGMLTIDGNRDKVKSTVKGSALFVCESAVLNLYNGVTIANNVKLGNERVFDYTDYVSVATTERAGGAAILNLNATVNMYGGLIDNNLVATEHTIVKNADGTETWYENNGCGGAVYNRGNFNMYGGTISRSEGLRGGALYNDRIMYLVSGTVSDNVAYYYGAGVGSSSSSNADLFIGSQGEGETMLFKNNHSHRAGGALYSNTSSPIVILGNTEFVGNHSSTSGGAIYTAGPLTISDTVFDSNYCVYSGGAIYHHYTKAEVTRRFLEATDCEFKNNSANLGGAVILSASDTVADTGKGTIATITNCNFEGNKAVTVETANGNGGALYITRKSEATIEGCTFNKNSADVNAGAVAIHSNSIVKMTNCEIKGNTAALGGGVYTSSNASLDMKNVKFEENSAKFTANNSGGNGGGIYIYEGNVKFNNVDFLKNSADNNAGAVYQGAVVITIDESCSFEENSAGGHGGAFYLTYKTLEDKTKISSVLNATNVEFKSNSAYAGGAISIRTSCEANLNNVKLTENSATATLVDGQETMGGGAVYVGFGKLNLTNVTMDANTSVYYGGAIFGRDSEVTITGGSVKNSGGVTGGALYFREGCKVEAENIEVTDNTATLNGVIYINGGSLNLDKITATGNKAASGGVLFTSGTKTTVDIKDSVLNGNSANTGGVINMSDATVTVTNCEMKNNTAKSSGAVYSKLGNLISVDCLYSGNSATTSSGGALNLTGGTATLTGNNRFENNSAAAHAGAIYVVYHTDEKTQARYGATLNMTGGSFIGNTAMGGAAISIRTDAQATVDGAVFAQNTVTGNDGKADGYGEGGGAIYAGYGKLILKNATLTENTSENHSGAIHLLDNDTEITNCTFENNSASVGGAVYAMSTSQVKIANCSFTENEASGNAGAMYLAADVTAELKNLTFDSNHADGNAGALYIANAQATIENLDMFNNSANGNGGAIYLQGKEMNIDSTYTFKNNSAGGHGGAFYLTYATVDNVRVGAVLNANGVTFEGNSAMAGGAISARTSCQANLTDCVLSGNTVEGYVNNNDDDPTDDNDGDGEGGGAIYVGFGSVRLENVTATQNSASHFGGVIDAVGATVIINGGTYSKNTSYCGGVISALGNSKVTVTGATISENESVYENTDYNSSIGGGALWQTGGSLTISSSTLDGNKTDYYGGTIMATDAKVTINENTVVKNSSGATGAALHFKGTTVANLENIEISGNISTGNGVVYLNYGELNANNVTFKNNEANNGGVFYCSNSKAKLTVTDCTITNNKAKSSGGIAYVDSATAKFIGGTIANNTAKNGGAIYSTNGNITVEASDVNNNSASSNGGVVNSYFGTVAFKDITVYKNSAKSNGGAAYFNQSEVTLDNVKFNENTANNHGGAVDIVGADVTAINGCEFNNNTADNHGGAVYVVYIKEEEATETIYGTFTMTGGLFNENSALGGGAVSVRTGCEATFDGTTFTQNSVEGFASENDGDGEGGGAIYVGYGKVTLINVTATQNTASDFGGAIDAAGATVIINGGTYSKNTTYSGGVIFATNNSSVTIDGATFTENASTFENTESKPIGGGAIYIKNGNLNVSASTFDKNTSDYYAGAIYASKATVKIDKQSIFTNNSATTGGALYFRDNCAVTIENSTVNNNSGTHGAIYQNSGTLTVVGLTATENNATSGVILMSGENAVANISKSTFTENSASSGAAINNNKGKITVSECVFERNTSNLGGAIFNGGGTLEVIDSTFTENSAKLNEDGSGAGNGGAISIAAGTVTLTGNNTFRGNTATNHGGAIYVSYSINEDNSKNPGILNAQGGLFEENSAKIGGAISSRTSCQVTLNGTVLKDNSCSCPQAGGAGGGAIYSNDGTLTLSGATLEGNTSPYYGGAVYTVNTNVTMNNGTTFKGNGGITGVASYHKGTGSYTVDTATYSENIFTTGTSNGVIYISGSIAIDVKNMTATGNKAVNGGVFYISGSNKGTISNSTFTGNISTKNGAVLNASGSCELTIKNCTIQNNTSNEIGGAIYASGNSKVIVSDNTIFKGNTALAGGAIFADLGTKVTVSDSTFEENTATGATENQFGYSGGTGGAIVVADTTKTDTDPTGKAATTVILTNVIFKKNTAQLQGGAISTDQDSPNLVIKATGCTFEGNKALTKGGGAVEIKNKNQPDATDPTEAKIVFTNCTFTANESVKSTGGAIEIRTSSYIKIDCITATGNKAKANGGAIYVTSNYSRLYLTGTVTQSGNTTGQEGPFVCLYNSGYSNPPKIYTTHSSSASWYASVGGNKTSVAFDLTVMP